MKRYLLITLSLALCTLSAMAQSSKSKKSQKIKIGSGDEAIVLSTARVANSSGLTNLRFSYYFNMGLRVSQAINKKIGWYTGAELKNVGIAQRSDTIRERFNTYYAGIPLALQYKLRRNRVISLGTGVDFALHAKDKTWTIGDKRDTKEKQSEWFPDSRNLVNPYVFASFKKSIVGLKLTYYFQDYFSPSSGYPRTNLFNISVLLGGGNNKAAKMGFNSAKKKKVRNEDI